MLFSRKPASLPTVDKALPGRSGAIATAERHFVFDRALKASPPEGYSRAVFGLGCFWGAERLFWQMPGTWLTSVGYAGGLTENPTYEETCSGLTGHAEVVEVIHDPKQLTYETLLQVFWESHDPTQGMRQGNDVGTQYRSAIFTTSAAQREAALQSRSAYQAALSQAGRSEITTQIAPLETYFYAEDYHQQYLAKNPNGYCGIGGTGVSCPIPASG